MCTSDPFSKIPTLLLLSIVKLIPDLGTLYSLDKASPTIASLINEYGAEIIEDIMPETLSEKTRNVIRIIAMIKSNSLPSRSLSDFCDTYIIYDKPCKFWDMEECSRKNYQTPDPRPLESCKLCAEKPLSLKFSASVSPQVIREILELSFQIRCLTGFCLQTMIDRCTKMEPAHLLKGFGYRNLPFPFTCPQKRPQGQKYQPQNAGPPIWIEQERICQALWRILLFFNLKTAATNSKLDWPHQDVSQLQNFDSWTFWENSGTGKEEYIKTVVEFMCEQVQIDFPNHSYNEYLEILPRLSCAKKYLWNYGVVSRPLNDSIGNEIYIDQPSSGLICAANGDPSSPLKYIDRTIFRRVGLFIWGQKRLALLGFANYFVGYELLGIPILSISNMWFTWESILSKEEIEEQERHRIAQFPESQRQFGSMKRESYWYMSFN